MKIRSVIININEINVLVLAYLGDNVYEYYIRKFLINKKIGSVNELQKNSINYVSAINQSKFLLCLLEKGFFYDFEIDIIKRARNHKGTSHPKNCDIVTYKHATALEALIGYLELQGNRIRIEEIMSAILGGELC